MWSCHSVRHEGVWGRWGIGARFLIFGTRWRWAADSRPGRITPGRGPPGTHWIGGWLGPDPVRACWRSQNQFKRPVIFCHCSFVLLRLKGCTVRWSSAFSSLSTPLLRRMRNEGVHPLIFNWVPIGLRVGEGGRVCLDAREDRMSSRCWELNIHYSVIHLNR
jgi:hypothetical protein